MGWQLSLELFCTHQLKLNAFMHCWMGVSGTAVVGQQIVNQDLSAITQLYELAAATLVASVFGAFVI